MAPPLAGRVRVARTIYLALATLFAVGVLVQALWAGLAVMWDADYWKVHVAFVHAIELVPVLLIVTALVGGGGKARWILPIVSFVLISLQYATLATRPSAVAGVHVMNALIIFGVALEMVRRAWAWQSETGAPR